MNQDNNALKKYGIEIYNEVTLESIEKSPPTSNFVVFSFTNASNAANFYEKLLKDQNKIEKLPYRIFLKYHENSGISVKDEFLNKRICVLSESEFKNIKDLLKKNDPREAVIKLYCRWLLHLIEMQNNIKDKNNGKKYEILIIKDGNSNDTTIIRDEVKNKYKFINYFFSDKGKNGDDANAATKVEYNNKLLISIEERNGLENIENKIIYSRHHKEIENIFYYEGFSGDSVSFPLYIWWPKDEVEKKLRACLLFENSLLSLVIADERVCEVVQGPKSRLEQNKLHFIKKFIGDNEVSITNSDRSNTILDLKNGKVKITNSNVKDPSILIIHQGILDKAFADKSLKGLEKQINILKNKFPFIVVTSGRGRPANTPENVKFLLLSDIMVNLRKSDYPDKLGLINIIMNISEV